MPACTALITLALFLASPPPPDAEEDRIRQLEERIRNLEQRENAEASPSPSDASFPLPHIGGYGEFHANFTEGDGGDKMDLHRLVLYLGIDFADWIQFHSETEIEHAYVSDGDGDLVVEQAHFDLLLHPSANLRLGRVLAPLGITNKYHEPTSFNGVERPALDRVIIPTTWSVDGAGLFGEILPGLQYEAYVVGGLDGSGFNAANGLRGGRIKERPSLNEPAFVGRLEATPFLQSDCPVAESVILGFSGFAGGVDNGDNAADPDLSGFVRILSADLRASWEDFDLRSTVAHVRIRDADEIGGGTASEIFGWNLELAWHFWAEAWKAGKLEKADAIVFLRYDDFDTQYNMPSGTAEDERYDRSEWTAGIGFLPVPSFVIKLDVQFTDDRTSANLPHRVNLGVGFDF